MITHGWEMVYFALAYVMYCDVCLRKASSAPDKALPKIDDRTAHLATLLDYSGMFNRRSSEDEAALEALRGQVANLENALSTIRQSSSWRITSPLRAIVRALGR
jgi:hypothetical protein